VKWSAAASPILPIAWQKGEIRVLGVVVLVCCAIGLAGALQQPLSAVSLRNNLVPANATGLSIYAIATFIRLFFNGRLPPWGIALAILFGNVLGSKLGALTGSPDYIGELMRNPLTMRRTIVNTVALGIVVTSFFLYLSHSRGVKEQLEREQRRAAEALQAETLARLSLLQAQIEPHFLFNTLANVQELVESGSTQAAPVLKSLIAYLRAAMPQLASDATLATEASLVRAYLELMHLRMPDRLAFSIDIPSTLARLRFPSMALLTLVENAICHGIDPAEQGGRIDVRAERLASGEVRVSVVDTGGGLLDTATPGTGLANLRERLQAFYGNEARLELAENTPHGVNATIAFRAPEVTADGVS
jgi:signal transduction histidine kinase